MLKGLGRGRVTVLASSAIRSEVVLFGDIAACLLHPYGLLLVNNTGALLGWHVCRICCRRQVATKTVLRLLRAKKLVVAHRGDARTANIASRCGTSREGMPHESALVSVLEATRCVFGGRHTWLQRSGTVHTSAWNGLVLAIGGCLATASKLLVKHTTLVRQRGAFHCLFLGCLRLLPFRRSSFLGWQVDRVEEGHDLLIAQIAQVFGDGHPV